MALKPVDNETFYREVDEELRRDQMRSWWDRYGKALIAGIVLVLAGIAGFLWWQNQKALKAGQQGETLISAFEDASVGNRPAATAKLDTLAKSSSEGYRAAALLTKADLAIEANDPKGAVALFQQVAGNADFAQPYRDLANVRMTALEYDSLKPQAVIDRLKPLAVPASPWFGSAGEMVAIAYLRLNQPQQAAKLFGALGKDKNIPDSLRGRAQQMAGSLGVDALEDLKPVNQEGQE
ncbi:MAG TPA: tetratricopeptide repeat protein [Allosphingosinicella sp.]